MVRAISISTNNGDWATIAEMLATMEKLYRNMRHCKIVCVIYNNKKETCKKWSLSSEICGAQILNNFKLRSLVMFDDKSDSQEWIITINMQKSIIGDIYSLKWKLMADTLKKNPSSDIWVFWDSA